MNRPLLVDRALSAWALMRAGSATEARPRPTPTRPPASLSDPAGIARAAAAEERARMAAIETLRRPGAEAIIRDAIRTGARPDDTAHRILLAENHRRITRLRGLARDCEIDPAPAAATTSALDGQGSNSLLATFRRVEQERTAATVV